MAKFIIATLRELLLQGANRLYNNTVMLNLIEDIATQEDLTQYHLLYFQLSLF